MKEVTEGVMKERDKETEYQKEKEMLRVEIRERRRVKRQCRQENER